MPFQDKASKAVIAARRTKAIRLRTQGMQWEDIATECGYKSRGAANTDVSLALQARLKEQGGAADELRAIEIAHLDMLRQKAWEVLEASHVTVSHGKVIKIKDSEGNEVLLPDSAPILAAIDRLVRIAERRAKLCGIDSPIVLETHGTVKYEVVGVSAEDFGAAPVSATPELEAGSDEDD
jgi:hypothetical protein